MLESRVDMAAASNPRDHEAGHSRRDVLRMKKG